MGIQRFSPKCKQWFSSGGGGGWGELYFLIYNFSVFLEFLNNEHVFVSYSEKESVYKKVKQWPMFQLLHMLRTQGN